MIQRPVFDPPFKGEGKKKRLVMSMEVVGSGVVMPTDHYGVPEIG